MSNALGVVLSCNAGVEREEQEQVFVPPKIKQMRQRDFKSSISVMLICNILVDNLFIVVTSFSFGNSIITQAEQFVKSFLKNFLKIFCGVSGERVICGGAEISGRKLREGIVLENTRRHICQRRETAFV